jgi:hypothetical protein
MIKLGLSQRPSGHPQNSPRRKKIVFAMSEFKERLDRQIRLSITENDGDKVAARRLYLFNSSIILEQHPTAGFEIIDAVSRRFKVSFKSVAISGSSQTGYSYSKKRDFMAGESDLDLALIDCRTFQIYSEFVYYATNGYRDLTKFPINRDTGRSKADEFRDYLLKGYFRPDLMPYGPVQQEWFKFFNDLSKRYLQLFKNINCGIFLSEGFFEGKQRATVDRMRRENK